VTRGAQAEPHIPFHEGMTSGTTHSASAAERKPGVILAVLALGALAYSVLQSIVAPALPRLGADLHASTTDATWILTGFLLSASVLTPVFGRLGDIHGKHRLLVVALALLTLGTLVCALADSLGLMLAGRVLQGAGGGVFPLAFSIVRDELPRERVGHAIALLSAMLGIGGALGVVVAGVIVENLSYHWLFWIPLGFTTLATITAWRLVPESPVRQDSRVNWLSAALLAAGLVVLLLGITQAGRWGWGSTKNLAFVAGGLGLLGVYVRAELAARVPLADMKVMAARGVWTTNAVTLLVGFGMFAGIVVVPALLEMPAQTGYGFGDSVLTAGLYLVPNAIAMLLVGPVAARLAADHGAKVPALLGTALTGVAYALLAVAHATHGEVIAALVLQGIGIGLAFSSVANLIVDAVPHTQTGAATAINTIMRTVGGAFGSSIPASILAAHTIAGTPAPTEGAFTAVFWVAAGVMALGVAAGLAVPSRRRARNAAPSAIAQPVAG
jgi:EmrB/QacA subfamily drug resistance transporter